MSMDDVYDVTRLPVAPRSLHELGRLRALLAEGERTLPFSAGEQGLNLLTHWMGSGTEHGEALLALAAELGAEEQRGFLAVIEGLPGSGKTHLLLALAAVAGFPASRAALADLWGLGSAGASVLTSLPRFLVIPVPLADHAGASESLDEILFEGAEHEAARPPFSVDAPLSTVSYTLKVVQQHLLPLQYEELDAEARARGFADWMGLVQSSPRLAAALARSAAAELGVAGPLVPSRSERLAGLLQLLPADTGVLWLLDDLHDFLAAAGPKGAREDIAFLEFLAQRAKVSPVYAIATGSRASRGLAEELCEELLRLADKTHTLAPEHLRPLLSLGWIASDEERERVLGEAMERFQKAWPSAAPSTEVVRNSYPLHPLALRTLEQAGARSVRLSNFALRCLRNHPQVVKGRPPWRLIGLAEVAACLIEAVRAGAPAEQIQEVVDSYSQRAGDLWPQDPGLVLQVVSCLLAGQLAAEVLTPQDISEALGIDSRGRPRLSPCDAEKLLAAMAHATPYLRKVQVNGAAAYLVVWRLPADEQARREFERVRAGIAPTDRRLEEVATRLLGSDRSLFADFAGGGVAEITWCNAPRFVWVEIVDPRLVGEEHLIDLCNRITSPDSPESAALLLGVPFHQRQQMEAWRRLGEALGNRAGADGLVLWLPQEVTVDHVEPLRTLVACAQTEEVVAPLGQEMIDHVHQERTLAEAAALAAVTALYFEGQVVSTRGVDVDGRSLSLAAEDLGTAVARAVNGALRRVHSEFPRIAPKRPLLNREPVDLIYEQLVQPGVADLEPGSMLGLWAEAVLGPLGFLAREGDRVEITARGSLLVRPLMDLLRARDTSSAQEIGRAVDCAEIAGVLFKSRLGLPPELFELTAAVLVRLGYLVALDGEHRPVVVQDVPPPFAATVKYLARAPALGPTRWQAIGRLIRAIGSQGTIAGDYEGQQHAWDMLVAARHEWLELIADTRERLGALWENLDQGPEQWQETLEELDAAEHLFRLINPAMPAPLGLVELADAVCELVAKETSFGALANFLSRLRSLASFLTEDVPDVVGVYRYLVHPKLNAELTSDVGMKRAQLLEFISGGEGMVRDLMTFRRLQQVFFVTYARRYISWHTRAYQSDQFERCAAMLNSPEFRALERLGRLEVNVEHDAAYVRARVEEATQRRCTYAGLDRSLRISPVCPQCGLELGYEPELPDADDLAKTINLGLREYAQVLAAPEFREQLRKYMAALPRWGDLSARLLELLNITGTLSPRQVLTLFSDEVILHLNRVLAGQIIVPRDLGELRRALQGKTLTQEEARRIVIEWLEGSSEDEEDHGDELYEFED